MSETVRTFIAIEMPPPVREFLDRCQERLRRAGGDVRWVRTDLVHLTLVFLGNVAADEISALTDAVREAASSAGPMTLQVAGVGRFPPTGRPRVVWVGVEEPTGMLVALQKRLAEATAAFAEKVEKREYKPHLTLGRVRGGDLRPLAAAIEEMAEAEGPAFDATEVIIMESRLAPKGPEYTPLAHVPLSG